MRRRTSVTSRGLHSIKQSPSASSLPFVPGESEGSSCGSASPGALTDPNAGLHRRAILRLKRAILEDYSYRDLRRVGWEKRFAKFERTLRSSRTAQEFAQNAGRLLSVAKDIHLWLRVNDDLVPTYRRFVRRNIAIRLLPTIIPCWRRHNAMVATGEFPDGIKYLCLRAWPPSTPRQLQPAFKMLRRAADSGGVLIIDVRANGGGAEWLAARFAGCFIRRPVSYARHLTRRNGKFSRPIARWLMPSKTHRPYQGKVVVLAGAGTVSSCESFVQMMKQVKGCKVIGQFTAGASGNPKPVELGNGVVAFVPSWLDLTADGHCLEGRGIKPDIEVRVTEEAFADQDPVLATALRFLRSQCSRRLRDSRPSASDVNVGRIKCCT